jgi:hypothetical protein
MDEATRRHLSARLDFHAEKLRQEQAAWADYRYRKAHPWYGFAADVLDGFDDGLTEVLRLLGIDRVSKAERRAAEALAALTERR